ncbi:hypothetical protein [Intestinimonas butyriciproducens]|uniref:hypothetical protein n=1 Tax=Intestinimonas butyriciproducens TaxID=1297617 RepID=UPI00242BEE66|nr:hypothetical protein [Intestinimonas butyriciproducens]MCI6363664.1 hypothetical protein [Intestinimonas butyriciproducens]MDY3616614.1 hypothetical protein [Intestinimonas butyriciproducens]
MSVTASIKALLGLTGKKQNDLMDPLGMRSKQSLSNKVTNGRWSADDLAVIADLCGCDLAFVLPNGQYIIIQSDPDMKKGPDE